MGEPWTYYHGSPKVYGVPGALASAGVSYGLPQASSFRIEAVTFRLVTVAGGGARQVTLRVNDGDGVTVYGVASSVTQAGGLTVDYSFGAGIREGGTAALGLVQGPFVGGRLPEHLTVAIAVSGTAAADALSNVRLLVVQWDSDE